MLELNWKLEPCRMWQPGGPSQFFDAPKGPMPSAAPDVAAVKQASYERMASPQPMQSCAPSLIHGART